MSARDRQRREHVAVRLAELRARHGDESGQTSDTADIDPTWGPVGSLAQRAMSTDDYAHLLALHHDMLALERARKAAEHDSEVLH